MPITSSPPTSNAKELKWSSTKDCSKRQVGGITHKLERKLPIRCLKDRCGGKPPFQLLKGFNAGLGYLAEIFDELFIKTCMFKKAANLPHKCGVRERSNNIDLGLVDLDTSTKDEMS
ncbi:hypothetical protein CR513_36580, partial [Mucuna pruriens]